MARKRNLRKAVDLFLIPLRGFHIRRKINDSLRKVIVVRSGKPDRRKNCQTRVQLPPTVADLLNLSREIFEKVVVAAGVDPATFSMSG